MSVSKRPVENIAPAGEAVGRRPSNGADSKGSNAAPAFTPGPWSIEEVNTHDILIASAATPADGEWTVATVWRDCAYLQEAAPHNAHLIAAAPELYEALKFHAEQVYAILSSDGYADVPSRIIAAQEHVTAWRSALAKAEGRS